MEWTTTKRHRLWYNQYFQEWAQQVEEESDGLLHGPMASSALKDSEEQVRPHLVWNCITQDSAHGGHVEHPPSGRLLLLPHMPCTVTWLEFLAAFTESPTTRLHSPYSSHVSSSDANIIRKLSPRRSIRTPVRHALITVATSLHVSYLLTYLLT